MKQRVLTRRSIDDERNRHETMGDHELVSRSRGGDKDAYRVLVERYQQRVFLMIGEIVKNRADAEDITQECFVKAYLSLSEFKGESKFFTWLYRIAYNMAIDFTRKIARRGGDYAQLDETHGQTENILMGHVDGPHDELDREDQRKQIRAALESISEEHRIVITLREIDGLSYEEIAKVTGVSRGTVMSRLHYARKKVQNFIHQLTSNEGSGDEGRDSRFKPAGTRNAGGEREDGMRCEMAMGKMRIA